MFKSHQSSEREVSLQHSAHLRIPGLFPSAAVSSGQGNRSRGNVSGKQQMFSFPEIIPLLTKGLPLASILCDSRPSPWITSRFNTLSAPDKLLQPTVAGPEIQGQQHQNTNTLITETGSNP